MDKKLYQKIFEEPELAKKNYRIKTEFKILLQTKNFRV
jgi:hypothetical protein